MRLLGPWVGGLLLMLLMSVSACSLLRSESIPSSPLFVPDPQEVPRVQALAWEQDTLLTTCAESHTCDRAHFTRALAALYEDQSVAAKHFQYVIDVAPKSRLASSSQFWLQFLKNPPGVFARQSLFAEATERLVREVLELDSSSALAFQREVKARDKKVEERDKKVEELTQQLEALKRIDQEMKEKSRPTRPPTKMSPPVGTDNHP